MDSRLKSYNPVKETRQQDSTTKRCIFTREHQERYERERGRQFGTS